MDGKKGLHRLFRWPRLRPEPAAIDAADVGTAYGMELSIDEATGNHGAVSKPATEKSPVDEPAADRLKRR